MSEMPAAVLTELQLLSNLQISRMHTFFLSCQKHKFGPGGHVNTQGALTLKGYKTMSFFDFCVPMLDKTPLVLHLGIWGAQEGKTLTSHTGQNITRFMGADVHHLFLDLLPFCVHRVKTFKEIGGDDCFIPSKMPLDLKCAWRACAQIAGQLAQIFITHRGSAGLTTAVYGMGPGAAEWALEADVEKVIPGPHPSSVRGHPATLAHFKDSALKVRAELGLVPRPDETSEVLKLFREHGLDEKIAKSKMASAMHLPPAIVKEVIVFGYELKLNPAKLSSFIGQMWWTEDLLRKGRQVHAALVNVFISGMFTPSFWSVIAKADDPVEFVNVLVDALKLNGLKNYSQILANNSIWSAFANTNDPVEFVNVLVDALKLNGLKNYSQILANNSIWSAFANTNDPVELVHRIVKALKYNGLNNYSSILSNSSSWSAFAKADDPVELVHRLVHAFKCIGFEDYKSILQLGSSWSAVAHVPDPIVYLRKLVHAFKINGLHNYKKILLHGGSWSAMTHCRCRDPVIFLGQLVNALKNNGLVNFDKILLNDSSWSKLCNVENPEAYVTELVNAFKEHDILNYPKILMCGSAWSAMGRTAYPSTFLGLLLNALKANGILNYREILLSGSAWSAISRAADPIQFVGKLVNAMKQNGLTNYSKILKHTSPWYALANTHDPIKFIHDLVNALKHNGLINFSLILELDASWSYLNRSQDPILYLKTIVDALKDNGLTNYENILTKCGSCWSVLGNCDNPSEFVDAIVGTLEDCNVDMIEKILVENSSWSTCGSTSYIAKILYTLPLEAHPLLLSNPLWARMKEYEGCNFWSDKCQMFIDIGISPHVKFSGHFWKESGAMMKAHQNCLKAGITSPAISNACKSAKILSGRGQQRYSEYVTALVSLL